MIWNGFESMHLDALQNNWSEGKITWSAWGSMWDAILFMCWQLWESAASSARHLIPHVLNPNTLSLFLFLLHSETHLGRHRTESLQLPTQIWVLIALWCNSIRPLMPLPQTPFRPLLRADESEEVGNCFWLSRVPHPPSIWTICRPRSEHRVFLMRLPPVYAKGTTDDSW